MPRDWRVIVDGDDFSDTMRLVHLAARMGGIDEDAIRAELLKQARRIFESELTIQAQRIGCPGRSGMLGNGPILSEINDQCSVWAVSIVNTYNYDLAAAIVTIRSETPTANRDTYAARLRAWDEKRSEWKAPQIAEYTEGWARSLAQQYFRLQNTAIGVARLEPTSAMCPVCSGWIARGEVPLREALNHPPPYHVNCPHIWIIEYEMVAQGECQFLWMGE
jgi:hypothetical protein